MKNNRTGRYVEVVVDRCPLCSSDDVIWSDRELELYYDFGNGVAWRQGMCADCGSVWEEQYDIARVLVMCDGTCDDWDGDKPVGTDNNLSFNIEED